MVTWIEALEFIEDISPSAQAKAASPRIMNTSGKWRTFDQCRWLSGKNVWIRLNGPGPDDCEWFAKTHRLHTLLAVRFAQLKPARPELMIKLDEVIFSCESYAVDAVIIPKEVEQTIELNRAR